MAYLIDSIGILKLAWLGYKLEEHLKNNNHRALLGHEIGKWAEKNFTYCRLELGRYELTQRDRKAWPVLRDRAAGPGAWPYDQLVKLPEPAGRGELDEQTLSHYEENPGAGAARHLRVVSK